LRFFTGISAPYAGLAYATPVKLGGISAQVVPLLFQWLFYGASTLNSNINVSVDLSGSQCRALGQIRSVYIDNLGSPNPVYVYFLDTNYTIAAKANSEGWYPAFTNSNVINVIGEGFVTGNIPTTFVLLSNVPLPPAVNTEIDQSTSLYLASPLITRGTSIYNTDFGIPALADQYFLSAQLVLSNPLATPLWGTPYASGFLYVNSMLINILGTASSDTQASLTLSIESTGPAGILAQPAFIAPNVPNGIGVFPNSLSLCSGANIKLDATQTWQMRVAVGSNISSGTAQFGSAFTKQ
jgi:hypothetical protein